MNNNIEVIGIDHGWSQMKTSNTCFNTSIKCHSANYLEAFSSVYLETNSGSNSVMGILNCCCPAK